MSCSDKRRLRSFLCAVTALMIFVFAFTAVTAFAAAPKASANKVRVGYYEDEIFQDGASEGAYKKGYAYEYYRKLSEYTGWSYEYVYGTYTDLYQMLLDGEIDFLAGLPYDTELSKVIAYPDEPMGSGLYTFVKHDSDSQVTADTSTLSGKKIGVIEGPVKEKLDEYLSSRRIKAQVLTFRDQETLFASFDTDELDVIAVENDKAYGRDHAEVLCSFGVSNYYLCVTKGRKDLLSELNDAQSQLFACEPNFIYSLSMKYYPINASNRALSQAEKDWMSEHGSIRVGYLNNYLPYSDTDKDGNVTGIVKELTENIFDSLSLKNITITYSGYDSYDDMIKDVGNGTVDIVFPVGGGLYYAEENGIYHSNAVVSSSTELVYRDKFSNEKLRYFAVNKNNRMQYYYVKTNYPDAEITLYDSIDDCLNAVLKGKVGCTTLNGIRANDILRNSRYDDLSLLQLSRSDERCFGVKIGNEGLIKLVNRGLSILGDDYAQNLAFRYTDGLYEYTFIDMLSDHLWLILLVVLAVAVVIMFVAVRNSRNTKKLVAVKEQARLELEEKNTELEKSRNELAENDDTVSASGFGLWRIQYAKDKAPKMYGNAKMYELLGTAKYSAEEMYEIWHSRIEDSDLDLVDEGIRKMRNGSLAEITFLWDHPEKGRIFIRLGGVSKLSDDVINVIRGYIGDVTDTVREERDQKLTLSSSLVAAEHSERARMLFLNEISNELKTPLASIISSASLAENETDNKEQLTERLSKISASGQHIRLLINDILDMQRIDSGKISLDEKAVSLSDVINDIKSIVRVLASSKRTELTVKTQDVVCEDIVTDKHRLEQMLLNIISNAVNSAPANGDIELSVIEKPSENNDEAAFRFCIVFGGLNRDLQNDDSPDHKDDKNSDIGIAISRNIAEAMGGTVSVSDEDGKNCEYVIDLKFKKNVTDTKPVKLPALKGMRVLVAADDINTCLSACSMLRDFGMRPDWTNYGREALVRTQEASDSRDGFNAYIIDRDMSDLNVFETVRRIRTLTDDTTPIIMLTAYDRADIEAEAKKAGVTAFCSKPLFISELRSVMKNQLDKS